MAVNNTADVLLHAVDLSACAEARPVLCQYLAVPLTDEEIDEIEHPKSDIELLGDQWVAMFGKDKIAELNNGDRE